MRFEVLFPEWLDDLAEFEHEAKGYISGVRVLLSDGSCYTVDIFDPTRLMQDMEAEFESGTPFVTCCNLIVVLNVSRPGILEAVGSLVEDGRLMREFRRDESGVQ